MATKSVNGKSAILAARVPLELAGKARALLVDGENLSGFIVAALQREIEYRTGERSKPGPGRLKARVLV